MSTSTPVLAQGNVTQWVVVIPRDGCVEGGLGWLTSDVHTTVDGPGLPDSRAVL